VKQRTVTEVSGSSALTVSGSYAFTLKAALISLKRTYIVSSRFLLHQLGQARQQQEV
jgi:hypothetical protein